MGFDYDGTPRLYQTDPSGTYHAWKVGRFILSLRLFIVLLCHQCANSFVLILWGEKANAIGRSAKTVREFLEKNYTDEAIAGDNEAIKLAIKALLEVGSVLIFLSNVLNACHTNNSNDILRLTITLNVKSTSEPEIKKPIVRAQMSLSWMNLDQVKE